MKQPSRENATAARRKDTSLCQRRETICPDGFWNHLCEQWGAGRAWIPLGSDHKNLVSQQSSPQAYTSPADPVTHTQHRRCCAQGIIPNQHQPQAQPGKKAPSWTIKPQLPASSKFKMDQVASRCQSETSSASANVAQFYFFFKQAEIGKQEHCDMNFLQA